MIAVCVKWVPLRVEVDALSGRATWSEREYGLSLADQAALECALRQANAVGDTVTAITVGGVSTDSALREAFAAGVHAGIRIDAVATSGLGTAALIAPAIRDAVAVWCGDYSLDGATGSVPAFLSALVGVSQALGLVEIETFAPLTAVRRLDRGARERLAVTGPAVMSVEGSAARLRRASTKAVIDARSRAITVIASATAAADQPVGTRAYRPPSRHLAPPTGTTRDRVLAVTGANATTTKARRELRLTPAESAAAIVEQLTAWGYLPL